MKSQRFEGADDRLLLRAMALDPLVLATIAAQWQPGGLYRSPWANLVGGWCVQYHNSYGHAPAAALLPIYQAWAANGPDKATAEMVGSFLAALDADPTPLPASQYMLDLAQKHFARVSLDKLVEGITAATALGRVAEAQAQVAAWVPPTVGAADGVELLTDEAVWEAAFTEEMQPLITYPGALGEFFGHQLGRDAFISLMAPEKRGKTFWLMDIAWRGVLANRRVAYFAIGDMSMNQMVRRFGTRIARCPVRPGTVTIPTGIYLPSGARQAMVDTEEKEFANGLHWEQALRACAPHVSGKDQAPLKLVAKPAGTVSVADIRAAVLGWERGGWVPDVILVDYADILAAPPGARELRDQINANWLALRGLSQELHCLLVTATQSDSDSYGQQIITKKNFTDDKRKLAHVTGMVGINATVAEMEQDINRLNWVILREGRASEQQCVHVAGCRALGHPSVRSCWDGPVRHKPTAAPPPPPPPPTLPEGGTPWTG